MESTPARGLIRAAILGVVLQSSLALAQTIPVIEPGREADVQALFAPHRLGDVIAGWRFEAIDIDRDVIRVRVVRDGEERDMVLAHPGDAPPTTPSFAITHENHPALDALAAAVAANDRGDFWRAEAHPDPVLDAQRAGSFLTDGILWSLALFVWIVVLAIRASRDAPFERRYLFGLVLGAALVRWALAPRMLLGAWIFSRSTDLQRWIWFSPTLELLSTDRSFAEIDVMLATGFAYAAITPLAVFAHARWLLDGPRRGLIAAFVLAALPLHVRFSASEVAFIPSIVLASTLFATVHLGLRSGGAWRIAAALISIPLTVAVVTARPLNILFLPLVVWVLFDFGKESSEEAAIRETSRRARMLFGAVVAATGLVAGAVIMWARYSGNVREGLSIDVLFDAFALVFDLRRNTFLNVSMTPILLVPLAAWGAWTLRGRERRRVIFLGAWIAMFFVTHAYVVPKAPAMQARYHLHLVVPFVFLVALAVHEWMRRTPHARWVSVACCAYVAFSPLLHGTFITDVAFNDHREVAFARSMVDVVPEGCTIREHPGPGGPDDLRARRVGSEIRDGVRMLRWPEGSECVWYFESLACVARKELDHQVDPACVELRRSASWELVRESSFESRIYDENLAQGLREGDIVTLSLYRAR